MVYRSDSDVIAVCCGCDSVVKSKRHPCYTDSILESDPEILESDLEILKSDLEILQSDLEI